MSSPLNATVNAIAGISTLTSLGSNASLAQPSTNLLGVNVPGLPLISFRDYFLTTMESWITTLPLRTQYIAFFDTFPIAINTNLIQSLELTDAGKKDFNIDEAKSLLTAYPFQGVVGCIFLQGADIPSENLAAGSAKIDNNRGFIQGSILEGRDAFVSNPLTLQFRETNTSFTDFIMRPWLILASHLGYGARPGDTGGNKDPLNIKCNITIVQYGKTFQNISQIPRKVWTFYNCVPLNLSNRNLTYDKEAMEAYDVSFLYDYYGVHDNLYIPIPDLISEIGNGSIPRISPFQS